MELIYGQTVAHSVAMERPFDEWYQGGACETDSKRYKYARSGEERDEKIYSSKETRGSCRAKSKTCKTETGTEVSAREVRGETGA